ncbi:AP-4 complex subunit epsilon-1-like [Clavelina lepadiformis]|uniref:AP-4 complex subunit epsilon-1-like n=1 Tax=Clavelina lepadiformis TaxID=159417 RepID=UPI00404389EC
MMSGIMNKTFNYAVDMLRSTYGAESVDMKTLFQALSTFEENDEVILKFLKHIKTLFDGSSLHQKRKFLTVVIFCSQQCFGSDIKLCLGGFGPVVITYIERSKTIWDKKLGYLTLTSLIESNSGEIIYLAVNTTLKDISSKHSVLITMALDVACHLTSVDLVPVLLPVVEKRLTHSEASVRSKALITLHSMYRLAPEFLLNYHNHIKVALSDRNPEVMAASLACVHDVVKKDPSSHSNIPKKLIFILEQVVQGNLPIAFSRHGISAPNVQIQILKILHCCEIDEKWKASLPNVLSEMMNRCQNNKNNVAFAVLYECIHTVVRLYKPSHDMFKSALHILRKFLSSNQANHLAAGLELLTLVTNIDISCCFQFQNIIMKSMEHPDETIKKQTLILLQALITNENYKVICSHMIRQLDRFEKPFFVKSFSEKLAIVAEKFVHDQGWLISTLHSIMRAAKENVSPYVSNRILTYFSKASSTDVSAELKQCHQLLIGELSFHHYKVIANIIGKYCTLEENSLESLIDVLIKQAHFQLKTTNSVPEEVAFVLLMSLKQLFCKVKGHYTSVTHKVTIALLPYASLSSIIFQHLGELHAISEIPDIADILKEDIEEYDLELSFLDVTPDEEENETEMREETSVSTEAALKCQPYSTSSQAFVKTSSAFMASLMPETPSTKMEESFLSKKPSEEHPKVWGKSGYKAQQATTTLSEALENLSAVSSTADDDKDMLDIMNDMFISAQTTASDVTMTDSNSPFHLFEKQN